MHNGFNEDATVLRLTDFTRDQDYRLSIEFDDISDHGALGRSRLTALLLSAIRVQIATGEAVLAFKLKDLLHPIRVNASHYITDVDVNGPDVADSLILDIG